MSAQTGGLPMLRAEIETLARRWMGFWQGGSLDGFDDVHAEGALDQAASGHGVGRTVLGSEVAALHRAFPDLDAQADLIAVDVSAGTATVRWTATGSHLGEFLGRPPSGRIVTVHGIETIRCSDGLVAERWGELDERAILTQLEGFPRAGA
jgi:predicted ester cyclase